MNNNLPKLQSLLGNVEFKKLEGAIEKQITGLVPKDDFLSKWKHALDSYKKWESTFYGQHTSTTNRKLQLYTLVKEVFPEVDLNQNYEFIDIVLSSFPKEGERIDFPNKGPNLLRGTVFRREITSRLGVKITIKLQDGSLISHEFFD